MRTRIAVILSLLLAAFACPAADQDRTLSSAPFTYVLDYGPKHIASPEYIETVAMSPPTLLHLGKDVPFTHNWGPIQALGGENQAYGKKRPYAKEDYIRRLSPEEVKQRIADLTKLTSDLHKAGVKWVTPYICSTTIGGNPETRAGLWEFYDHWDEYKEFALGERPKSDPIKWMQVMPDGAFQFFYKFTGPFYPPYEPNIRYAACHNNPDWRYWLERVTENAARCGFDGVFVDNAGSLRCYCSFCKAKWRDWIAKRYGDAERKALFGTEQPDLSDGKEPGLLWAETRRFWNACIAEHHAAIRKAGEKISGRPFVVFPNGGEQRPESVMQAFPDTDLIMFERSIGPYGTHPGMVLWSIVENIAVKKYNDNVFENKFVQCLRRKVRAIMLTRPGWEVTKKTQMILEMNPSSAILGCAETAAFGGGGGFLVRVNPECMAAQKKCRDFFEKHPTLYEGLDSFAEAAVAAFPEQTYFGNKPHILEVKKATQNLLDGHVLFDYVTEEQFTRENLKRYAVVVLPKIQNMSDAQAAALKDYVRDGGRAVVIGPAPELDEKGRKKDPPALDDILDRKAEGKEFTVKRTGSGATAYAEVLPLRSACLADWIAKDLALSVVVSPPTPILAKVRVNAFAEPDGKRYVAHFVNYNVPLGVPASPRGAEAKEPEILGPIDVALRLPTGAEGVKLTCYDPEGEAADLPAKAEGKLLRFTLPSLRVYKVVEITAAP
jgi:hypothetical protein